MPKYLYTSDLRISDLPNRIKYVANYVLSGKPISSIKDKSDNNNATTLCFYFNLYYNTEICKAAAADPVIAIRNYILKFQFPNTRTSESLRDSLSEQNFLAPYRAVVRLLHRMAELNPYGEGRISLDEILYFVFCNKLVYGDPNFIPDTIISSIDEARNKHINLESLVHNNISWNQYHRQVRELMTVLTIGYNCFQLKKQILYFSNTGIDYDNFKDEIDKLLSYNYIWYPSDKDNFAKSNKEYSSYMDTKETAFSIIDFTNNNKKESYEGAPLQQIFYGAPGTGKSNTIKKRVDEKGEKNYRTTFHPDSDYSSFVGCYKPVMEYVETKVVPVVENYNATISCQSTGTFKEKKIVYKFVKQAFLKAYINAWKLFLGQQTASSVHESVEVSYGIDTWIIDKVDENKAYYRKESHLDINSYKKRIQRAWKNGFKTDNYHETAAIKWYEQNSSDEERTVEKCWEAVWNELKTGGTIKSKPGSEQEYSISLEGETILIIAEGKGDGKGASKDAISKHFGNDDNTGSSVWKAIALKLKEYSENFEKAWKKFEEEVKNSQSQEPTKFDINSIPPLFLVIEEINRGNCAQIFGDLFQLLDRKNGFSEYPIIADEDIRKCLLSKDADDDPSFGVDGLNFSDEQRNFINAIYSEGHDIANKIANGEVLVLPPNLYIWATMNTSDQSLFPMDSAFKRRWDWEYIPICYDETTQDGKENKAYHFTITINEKREFSWINFLRVVNLLVKDATDSEDKQMGNFFIKHDVKEKEFISKVMFYLWSEVCKDNFGSRQNFFRKKDDKEFSFNELFDDKDHKILLEFMERLQDIANEREELKDKGIKIEITKNDSANNTTETSEEVQEES